MRKIMSVFLLCTIMGCSSTQIPFYIPEKKPFSRRFYANYSRVLAAANQALIDSGWKVEQELEPQVFEVVSGDPDEKENILLVTAVRESRLLLGTKYQRMNVYIYSKNDASDVEMRYLKLNNTIFFKSKGFGSEEFAQEFFARIQTHLGQ